MRPGEIQHPPFLLLVCHEEIFLPQVTTAVMFCLCVQIQAQWTEPSDTVSHKKPFLLSVTSVDVGTLAQNNEHSHSS